MPKKQSPRSRALHRLLALAWTIVIAVVFLPVVIVIWALVWLVQIIGLFTTGDHDFHESASADLAGDLLTWINKNLTMALFPQSRDVRVQWLPYKVRP